MTIIWFFSPVITSPRLFIKRDNIKICDLMCTVNYETQLFFTEDYEYFYSINYSVTPIYEEQNVIVSCLFSNIKTLAHIGSMYRGNCVVSKHKNDKKFSYVPMDLTYFELADFCNKCIAADRYL